MCVVSMVSDHYRDKWTGPNTIGRPNSSPGSISTHSFSYPLVNAEELYRLKAEVEEMKALLKRAKLYDEVNNEPDCEMKDKVAFLKKVAESVGVTLEDVFPQS